MNPTFKYPQGNFRLVSNNHYSPGMMPPPRPNAHYYTMYNHHQYLEQPRGSFMPPVLATNLVSNSRNMQRHFPVERNRFPNVGPQPMQGCSNTNIVKNATVTPERSIVQHQQPMQVEESVRENSIVKNQHRPPNDAVMDDNQTTNTKTDGHKTQTTTNFDFKVYGTSDRERTFMLTGTVDRVIKWGKIFQNQHCCSEVIAPVVSIQEGTVSTQKVMLLRDKGPILRVVYYETTPINIEDFCIGQMLTCTGRMTGPNTLTAFCIRSSSREEVDSLPRLTQISEQAVECHLTS